MCYVQIIIFINSGDYKHKNVRVKCCKVVEGSGRAVSVFFMHVEQVGLYTNWLLNKQTKLKKY